MDLVLRKPAAQVLVACAVGLLLGVLSVRFSPTLGLAALVSAGLAILVVRRPELGLLAILAITSTVISADVVAPLSIGVGSLQATDLILLGLLALAVTRRLGERDFRIPSSPLTAPLLIFYGLAMLSTVVAVVQGSVAGADALREVRLVTYYLTFFGVIALVRDMGQLKVLVEGIMVLGLIVAILMVAQAAVGSAIDLVPGRVATLTTQGVSYVGVTRVLPPGQSLILVGLILAITLLVTERVRLSNLARFIQAGLLGVAVILTFNRSFWVALLLAIVVMLGLTGFSTWRRAAWWGVLALTAAALTLVPFTADPESPLLRTAGAAVDRIGTLTSGETIGESSLQWRYIENSYAIPQIAAHPFIGLGLGAKYRPFIPDLDYGDDRRDYIHNGHFWIMIKTGLLGYLALVWLSAVFLYRSITSWRAAPRPWLRAVVLGFALVYLGVLVASVVNPILAQRFWVPVIGIMMGINELIITRSLKGMGEENPSSPSPSRAFWPFR